jgi:hypothetical protein
LHSRLWSLEDEEIDEAGGEKDDGDGEDDSHAVMLTTPSDAIPILQFRLQRGF